MYKLSFLNRDKSKKKEDLNSQKSGLAKAIYTEPISIEVSNLSSLSKPTRFRKVTDKELHLYLGFVNWFELIIVLCFFCVYSYIGIYRPIYDYNMDINVVRELAETGKSSYSKELQKQYGYESALDAYTYGGLNRYRKIAARDSDLFLLVIFLPLAYFGIRWMNFCGKHCRDSLVLNRSTGMLYYRYQYGLKQHSCHFNDAVFQSHMTSLVRGNSNSLALRFPNVKGYMLVSPALPYISLSLYVWYMDKNRPLPLGSAFDAYREEDYLRRKAAKFPDPLYPSGIATPEEAVLVKKYNDLGASKRAELFYDKRLKMLTGYEDSLRKKGEEGKKE